MRLLLCSLLFQMMLPIISVVHAGDVQQRIPAAADITAADQVAVERLGPNKGRLSLQPDIRYLQGLGVHVAGGALNVNQTTAVVETGKLSMDGAEQLIPKEADITAADQAVVARISPDKRALRLQSDIRSLEGLGVDTGGGALNINQAMADLKADVRENKILIQLSSDVLFDFDKVDIRDEAASELHKVALIIKEKAQGPVEINGHTDSKGSEDYNLALSVRRAKAVKLWLVDVGHAAAEYKIEGYGESQPVVPNTTPEGEDNSEGRAHNRRVEIMIQALEP